MEELRSLRPEDMEKSLALSQFAFQYELSPADKEERLRYLHPEDTWGIFVDGELAAKASILPLHAYVGGNPLAMGGIAGVATWPEYRRHGFVSRLLAHSLRLMKEQGYTLSMLAPFKFSFYHRYGWEHAFDHRKYEVAVHQLPRFSDYAGHVERTEDWSRLSEMYESFASRWNGMLRRDTIWWEWNMKKLKHKGSTAAIYIDAEGGQQGYLLYKVKDRILTIGEFVYLNEEARRGLWGFISNHDSMIDKVTLISQAEDDLSFLLPDPRVKQELIPYFMARIIDLEAFVIQYMFMSSDTAATRERVLFQVQDEHAPWNSGLFELVLHTEGHVDRFSRVEATFEQEKKRDDGLILTADIQTMTAMLMGYKRPEALYRIGRLGGAVEAVSILERRLPRRSTYLTDFF